MPLTLCNIQVSKSQFLCGLRKSPLNAKIVTFFNELNGLVWVRDRQPYSYPSNSFTMSNSETNFKQTKISKKTT